MNFNSMQWFNSSILIWAGFCLFLNCLISYIWHKKIYLKLGLKDYQSIQRIHLNETPRLGGFIFLTSLTGFLLYSNFTESILLLKLILISLIPVIIFGLKEDLFHNVDPALRFISLLLTSWIFIIKYVGPLPNIINIPIIGELFIIKGSVSLFYILSIAAIANGMNLIDGVNGLCAAASLAILNGLLFLSYKTGDIAMLTLILNFIFFLIPFVIINYPYGRIFLGDLGAYSLGLIVSMLTIILFGRHSEISPWGGVLILIYPATEVVFSFLRRIINCKSFFKPDTEHLHLELFKFFRLLPRFNKIANALVTPVLSALWLFPLIAITLCYQNKNFISVAIVVFIIFYGVIYTVVINAQKKLKLGIKKK